MRTTRGGSGRQHTVATPRTIGASLVGRAQETPAKVRSFTPGTGLYTHAGTDGCLPQVDDQCQVDSGVTSDRFAGRDLRSVSGHSHPWLARAVWLPRPSRGARAQIKYAPVI